MYIKHCRPRLNSGVKLCGAWSLLIIEHAIIIKIIIGGQFFFYQNRLFSEFFGKKGYNLENWSGIWKMCLKIVRDLSFAAVSANCLIQTKWHKSKTTIENRIQKAYFSTQRTTYNNNRKACNIEPSQIQWMNEWTNEWASEQTNDWTNEWQQNNEAKSQMKAERSITWIIFKSK